MTELAALNVLITGDASGLKAEANSAANSVENIGDSAQNTSTTIAREFQKSEKAVERLKMQIDPLYRATKKHEAAVETLTAALKTGAITQAEYGRQMQLLETKLLQADRAAARLQQRTGGLGGALGRLNGLTGETRQRIFVAGNQFQDMAVQMSMGTSAITAMSLQLPQLASVFGPVGIVVGTLAAIGLPMLGAAFSNSGKEATALENAINNLKEATESYRVTAQSFRLGVDQEEVLMVERVNVLLHEQLQLEQQIAAANATIGDEQRADDLGRRLAFVSEELGLLNQQLATYRQQRGAAEQVSAVHDQMKDKAEYIRQRLDEAGQAMLAVVASAPTSGWLAGAIGDASTLASTLWNAAAAAAAAASGTPKNNVKGGRGGDPRSFEGDPYWKGKFFAPDAPGVGGGGGGSSGGGGGVNPLQAEIEQLRASLLTKEQLELESFARQQEALQQALEQKLLTQQDYAALMEKAQQQHQDKMSEIDVWRYGTGLQKAEAFLGALSGALAQGGEKMQKAARIAAAAEALVNAWRAHNQVLADPSLPFFAKVPAALAILGAGLGAVEAIKGGKSSGGASSAAAAQPAAAPPQSFANITLVGDTFGRDQIAELFRQINEGVRQGRISNLVMA